MHGNNNWNLWNGITIGGENMCEFCKSEYKAHGYCTMCGKQVCRNCADFNDRKRHANCGPVPEPIPVEEPEGE